MTLPRRSPLVLERTPVPGRSKHNQRLPLVRQLRMPSTIESRWLERRNERAWRNTLPRFITQLSRALRSGLSIDRALHEVVEATPDLPSRVRTVATQINAGRPLDASLSDWAQAARSEPERLVVTAIVLGQRSGANLGPVLDGIADAVRDELALDARRRVLLVQAQLSAAVLVVLPLGFATVSSLARGSFTFAGPIGMALLAAGLFLDGVGLLWMRRLLRGLR